MTALPSPPPGISPSGAPPVSAPIAAPGGAPAFVGLASAASLTVSMFDDPEITLVLPRQCSGFLDVTGQRRITSGTRVPPGRLVPSARSARVIAGRSRAPRTSAPLALRIVVVSLTGVLAMEVGWLAAIHLRPLLAQRLENTNPAPAVAAPAHASSSLLGTAPNGLDYVVPAATYSLGFDISNPCWVVVRQFRSGATMFAATLQPGDATRFVPVTGNTSVVVSARANAIIVRDGSRTVGTITNPAVGMTYEFTSRPISETSVNTPS